MTLLLIASVTTIILITFECVRLLDSLWCATSEDLIAPTSYIEILSLSPHHHCLLYLLWATQSI